MEVNKNKKRYVYLDKYEEYKKQVNDRMNLLGKVIFWLGFVTVCTFLMCLSNIFMQQIFEFIYICTCLFLNMLYQLPNGKVVHLTLDQYLNLTDEDVQYLVSLDYGSVIHSPWTESAVIDNSKQVEEEDKSIDFEFESDELSKGEEQPMSDQEIIDNLEAPDPSFSE